MTNHLSVIPMGDGTSNLKFAFGGDMRYGGKFILTVSVGLKDYPSAVPAAFAA